MYRSIQSFVLFWYAWVSVWFCSTNVGLWRFGGMKYKHNMTDLALKMSSVSMVFVTFLDPWWKTHIQSHYSCWHCDSVHLSLVIHTFYCDSNEQTVVCFIPGLWQVYQQCGNRWIVWISEAGKSQQNIQSICPGYRGKFCFVCVSSVLGCCQMAQIISKGLLIANWFVFSFSHIHSISFIKFIM